MGLVQKKKSNREDYSKLYYICQKEEHVKKLYYGNKEIT